MESGACCRWTLDACACVLAGGPVCPGASDSDSSVLVRLLVRLPGHCVGSKHVGMQGKQASRHSSKLHIRCSPAAKEALYISSRRESCCPGIPLPILMSRWKMERPASAEPTPETRPGPPSTAVPGHSRACKRCDKKEEVQFRALHPSAGGGGCRQGHEGLTGPGEGGVLDR